MEFVHYTVMRREALQLLVPIDPAGVLIDATLGEGGHSVLFLERYPDLRVIGLDADAGIMDRARARLEPFAERVQLRNTWFDDFFAREAAEHRPALILLDLGISTYHYTVSGRGFSFREDEPLDMRLRADSGDAPTAGIGGRTAADIVNAESEKALADLFFRYGEERYSRRIAERIVRERRQQRISTTAELAEIVSRAVPAEYRRGRIHPATRTFQALRIAVNDELSRLERSIQNAVNALISGGMIGVISFHSLEDRIVKNVFRDLTKDSTSGPNRPSMKERARLRIVTKKPLTPADDEIRENPASRSAKFRVAEKL